MSSNGSYPAAWGGDRITLLPNGFFGLGLGLALGQTLFAFLAGCGFYVIRRLSGSLALPILLHAGWDFSSFVVVASGAAAPNYRIFIPLGTYLVSLALVITDPRRSAFLVM